MIIINAINYLYFNGPPSPYYLESGFQIHEVNDTHPNRTHLGFFDFILVREGTLHIGENNERWQLEAGQALILLPNQSHYSAMPAERQTLFYWIHFQSIGAWVQSDQEHTKLNIEDHQQCFYPTPYTIQLPKQTTFTYPQQAFQLLEQMNEANTERESNAYWKKQHAFEQLLKMMDMRQNNDDVTPIVRLAEQVENFIRNHYQESITNERLSFTFNYHYNYITRAMKQMYGMTPNEYVMKVRIDHAKSLLLNTHWSIAAIAEQVGFENTPYFSNCFSKHLGLSPSMFRNQYYE